MTKLKLEDMYKVIAQVKLYKQVFASLTYARDEWAEQSSLLRKLCFTVNEGGSVPVVASLVGPFDAVSTWTPQQSSGPLPIRGFDKGYDTAFEVL